MQASIETGTEIERPRILLDEFRQRIHRIQDAMPGLRLDAVMVYGDEYRKENLRYVSNFWPIFERGACFIPRTGEPILACAAEGEYYAREMSIWNDIRNLKEFAAVTVPEEIDYPLSRFASFQQILSQVLSGGKRLGIAGLADLPAPIVARIKESMAGLEIADFAPVLTQMRLIKSEAEIACLREAGRLACEGYSKLIAACVPGNSERMAAGAAEGTARSLGAEAINFMVFGSGPRGATIIGRPTQRVMREGEMVMASFAVQFEGYVATAEYPMVIGKASDKQKRFLQVLFDAANVQLTYLRAGANCGEMVRAVRDVFRRHNLQQYDVYPPMHGIGLAEAESPYPDENTTSRLSAKAMCVNSDISLFGHPDGSNRIEEGFVIRESGPESLTPLIRTLTERGVDGIR